MGKKLSVYTKPSRFNLVLSFEQYKYLLERKKMAVHDHERMRYKDLVEKWGIKQHHMASAVSRGIKKYDEMLKEEKRVEDNRRYIPRRFVEKRNESRTVGLRANAAATDRASLAEYTQGGAIRRGYSDYIRTEYFED